MADSVRDKLRSAIFNHERTKPMKKVVDFFDQKIEVRQMSLGVILDAGASENDRKTQIVDMIIRYSYVPDTEDRVFEDADRAVLLELPFGADFGRLQKAITEMTDVNVLTRTAEGNSVGADTTST